MAVHFQILEGPRRKKADICDMIQWSRGKMPPTPAPSVTPIWESLVSRGRKTPLEAIKGRCLECSYRLAWILVQGRKSVLRVATARPLLQ